MSDSTLFTTIWQSRELRQASESALLHVRFPDFQSGHRKAASFHRVPLPAHPHPYHSSLGVRRSTASTNLLHHELCHRATDSLMSLDSLEGSAHPTPTHSDSSAERRAETLWTEPPSASEETSKAQDVFKTPPLLAEEAQEVKSPGALPPGGGEGKRDEEEEKSQEEKETWETASILEGEEEEVGKETADGVEEEDGGEEILEKLEESLLCIEEEEEEDVEKEEKTGTPIPEEKKAVPSIGEDNSGTQGFQVLPKCQVPAEITHCLFELEEECMGVQRESEEVKWKMHLIHRSSVAIQETLRTLQRRLAEIQNGEHQRPRCAHHWVPVSHHAWHHPQHPHAPPHAPHPLPQSHLARRPSATCLPCYSAHPSHPAHLHTEPDSSHSHPSPIPPSPHPSHPPPPAHLSRSPSATCLPCYATQPTYPHHSAHPGPTCAQQHRAREVSFQAISDLREGLARLGEECAEDRKERREAILALKAFQDKLHSFINQWECGQREQSDILHSLQCLKEQTLNITELLLAFTLKSLTRNRVETLAQQNIKRTGRTPGIYKKTERTLSMFCQLGLELESVSAVGSLMRSVSRHLSASGLSNGGAVRDRYSH
nr:PREDICTED: pollen-specific leucine-rich repeat extensin-like protein 1 isoform X2 [Lepisosteus oculatus]